MSSEALRSSLRPEYDEITQHIVDYVLQTSVEYSSLALETARYAFMDALGCAFAALNYPACKKILGPVVPEAEILSGCHVPGTSCLLDPVRAAFNMGAMIRWLDFNDTWLAAEWGHPSDNLGAILPCAEYVCRMQHRALSMKDIFIAMIQAYEIQGILALSNSFNHVGLDHVLLVRIASSAVCARLLGGNREQLLSAVSNAWIDGSALRTYRHAPNTGSRKSWAAGDAASRGLWLALLALRNEMGYPSALTAPVWGFQDSCFHGEKVTLSQTLKNYVMENILFKVSFPAEFHAQTAVEAAILLHPFVKNKWHLIKKISIETQRSAIRIIDKVGPLANPADRDHCLQYMTVVALIKGSLRAEDYEDAVAIDPRIDALRARVEVVENPQFSADYLDSEKRSIANAVQIFFHDGSHTKKITVEYPMGHRCRREESMQWLREKFSRHALTQFSAEQTLAFTNLFADPVRLNTMPVLEFIHLFLK